MSICYVKLEERARTEGGPVFGTEEVFGGIAKRRIDAKDVGQRLRSRSASIDASSSEDERTYRIVLRDADVTIHTARRTRGVESAEGTAAIRHAALARVFGAPIEERELSRRGLS